MLTWSYLYEILPFALSATFKVFSSWGLSKAIRHGLAAVPGGHQIDLTNNNVATIVANHVEHAEARVLTPITYFASVFAAFTWGASQGQVGPSILGSFLLAGIGGYLVVFLNNLDAGTLNDPIRENGALKASSVLLLLSLTVDFLFVALISVAYLLRARAV